MATAQAPVKRGTKNPGLLAQVRPKAEGSGHVYVVEGRPMPYRGVTLPVGTEVPDAASWPRLDAWVGARRLRSVGRDEEFETYEDFMASLPVPDPPPAPPPPPPAPDPGPPPTGQESKTSKE